MCLSQKINDRKIGRERRGKRKGRDRARGVWGGEERGESENICNGIYRIAGKFASIKFGELALSRYWRNLNLANKILSAIHTHTIIYIGEF